MKKLTNIWFPNHQSPIASAEGGARINPPNADLTDLTNPTVLISSRRAVISPLIMVILFIRTARLNIALEGAQKDTQGYFHELIYRLTASPFFDPFFLLNPIFPSHLFP